MSFPQSSSTRSTTYLLLSSCFAPHEAKTKRTHAKFPVVGKGLLSHLAPLRPHCRAGLVAMLTLAVALASTLAIAASASAQRQPCFLTLKVGNQTLKIEP